MVAAPLPTERVLVRRTSYTVPWTPVEAEAAVAQAKSEAAAGPPVAPALTRRSSLWDRAFGAAAAAAAVDALRAADAVRSLEALEARLCDAFESADLDRGGFLSKRELYGAFARLGLRVTAGEAPRLVVGAVVGVVGVGAVRVELPETRRCGW